MADPTLFWHDYETWGADPRRDRPAQFAGIRTDLDLNIVGEPVVLHCELAPDYLPDPQACLITGLVPQGLPDAVKEPEFFASIQAELGQPGTCGIGYNSRRFDDEVTRFGLYRNFHDPYAREWKNGNSRWDLIDVARAAYALRPEGIAWPTHEDGTPSFRLTDLTAANGIGHENAHDALADVYATIAVARMLRESQPKLLEYAFQNRSKQRLEPMLSNPDRPVLAHVSSMTPPDQGYISPIVVLARHPVIKTAYIAFDLRQDPEQVLRLDAEALASEVFKRWADRDEDATPVGLRQVAANKFPFIAKEVLLNGRVAERHGLDLTEVQARRTRLLGAPGLREKLRAVYTRSASEPGDADHALYDGFITDRDRALCNTVLRADPEALRNKALRFVDERLNTLLFRYRARNWPDTLTNDERSAWDEGRHAWLIDGVDERRTFSGVRTELARLAGDRGQTLTAKDQRVLTMLGDYVDQIEASLSRDTASCVMLDDPDWPDIPPVLRRGTD